MKRDLANSWLLAAVFLVSTIVAVGVAEAAPCIPAAQATIDGYVPGQNKRVVAERRKPLEETKQQGEDDGGFYTATALKYALYQVVIVREFVDSVSTGSPALIWAAGIRVGDARSEIDNRIGYAKVSDSKDEAQYLVCSDVGDVYARLRFSSGKLVTIEVLIDRP